MIWGVYDEWRDYHMTASEFISFIDYYTNKMRVLYGYKNNFYKHILITTVQDLNEIYQNSKEDPFQWYKRITKVIDLDKNIEMSGRDYFNTRTLKVDNSGPLVACHGASVVDSNNVKLQQTIPDYVGHSHPV